MDAGQQIRSTVPISQRAEAAPPSRRADIFKPGQILGGIYHVVSIIGAGGMGQVFEAHDVSLDRRVAIKAAWPTTTPGRLREEARALAAVRHPSMVNVYSMGRHEATDFLVMERLYGIGLDEHIETRKRAGEAFRVDEVLDIVRGITDGLHAIHTAGLAHHDVKPENVMIAQGGRIVLLDLGIGLAEVNAGSDMRIEGSPAYMAPEVISRAVQPGGAHLADLYALGLISYELLAGDPPFDGETVMAIWNQHLRSPVPDVRRVRQDIPRRLAELITELLSKDPGERPQSAESVLWYLDSIRPRVSIHAGSEGCANILVVDDEPEVLQALGMLVREGAPGIQVRTASDGEEALVLVRQRMPDVLVTDLDMPRMNGIELCMHLRGMRTAERVAIVAISGTADVHDRQLLQSLGITRFVTKDADQLERLPGIIRDLLAERV
ncbi:MAG: serine/threonine-protein kinase [Deltaproteobacteria bacterium]